MRAKTALNQMTVIELAIKLAINKLYSGIKAVDIPRERCRGQWHQGVWLQKFHKCSSCNNNNNIDSRQLLQKDGGRQKACGAASGRCAPSGLGLGVD